MNRLVLPLLALSALVGCNDDTSMVGVDVMPNDDAVSALTETFNLETRTVAVDSVLANTATCYLGRIVDPELDVRTTCGFLAQFRLPENFTLPKQSALVLGETGEVEADSCDIRLYFEEYYGDSLASMKLRVSPLDKNNVLEESKSYYTNLNPSQYIDGASPYAKTISYAVKDLSRPESETSGTKYYRQVAVKLPAAYGTELMKHYYANPEDFTNSYQFIHKVCPGFYFQCVGGVGSLIKSKMMALNVYFRYHTTDDAGNDTIMDGMERFGATEEVIQTTQIENEYPNGKKEELLADAGSTYVKTPTGFFTEMTLPVSEIVGGEHYTDSLSQAKITIRKYAGTVTTSPYTIDAPAYLLLVRKGKMSEFFEKKQLPNSADSYLSNKFTSTSVAYQFSNIAQLVTDLKIERDERSGVVREDDEATRKAKYAAWEAQNPDWNKVLLIPVSANYTQTSSYSTTQTLLSVNHELGLTSARLEGGTEAPLKIEVIYSRYNR